ncbi:hypothetical protein [Mycobacteroides abscessus]|uniref:hypothetical protein n=1 Tax=Mycobacteroides abscessus TaxID=36809 RepID=UPI0027E2EE0F|nr:hypothetical protein [Mycobacteroides abscessus]
MRYDADTRTLELTARNIAALTAKLDDPASARMLQSGDGKATVHAVETAAADKVTAAAAEGVVTVTRAQLAELGVEGATVTVDGVTVVSVPDRVHYTSRPSGIVVMPSSGEVLESDTTHWRLRHLCEVCGRDEILTPAVAYERGWDYPPRMGQFGIISPRTCPSCPMSSTVWAALTLEQRSREDLSDEQLDTIARILAEPMSITVEQPE